MGNTYETDKNGKLIKIYVEDPILIIPPNVNEISENLEIKNPRTIREITFDCPQLSEIPSFTFRSLSFLEKVIFKNNNKNFKLNQGAFQSCTRLKEVLLPNDLTLIGDSCFERCLALEKLWLPSTVKEIGDWAFELCNDANNDLIKILYSGTKEDFLKIKNGKSIMSFYEITTEEKFKLDDLIDLGYNFNEANKKLKTLNKKADLSK